MHSPTTTVLLASIQIALPRELPGGEEGDLSAKPWTTGFYKQPVAKEVHVTALGVIGGGQADLINHGGVDKATCVYPLANYPHWQSVIGRELSPAAFGENFTVEGLTEVDVCIGDTWQVGADVVAQVSQPRQPCWKLARRGNVQISGTGTALSVSSSLSGPRKNSVVR